MHWQQKNIDKQPTSPDPAYDRRPAPLSARSSSYLGRTGEMLRPGFNSLMRRRSTAALSVEDEPPPEDDPLDDRARQSLRASRSDIGMSGREQGRGSQPKRPAPLRRTTSGSFRSSEIRGVPSPSQEGADRKASIASTCTSYKERVRLLRTQSREIFEHIEPYEDRVNYILVLAQSLLAFGAPSHRIESQLESAADILQISVGFVHMPNIIIANLMDQGTAVSETRFVRAGGRINLTSLHRVHLVYRDVLHDKVGVHEGTDRLRRLLRARPIYPIWIRCMFAFLCASIICTTAFGGSLLDMFIGGAGASALQFLGLRVATKSAMYANVYEISVSIIVSFVARALGTLSGNHFCYSAISSAGVVLILPGFTILVAALELTSRNIMCGSLRMVYAFIYTLFLGFGLSFGSDFYVGVSKYARHNLAKTAAAESEFLHGVFTSSNQSSDIQQIVGSWMLLDTTSTNHLIIKGCYRDPAWPWWRQPFPWWTLLFLVPIYAFCSSLANLQRVGSVQLPIMVLFSCAAYATTKAVTLYVSDHISVVSALGALVIGLCGNIWSRSGGGTAFTSMITGVLFLVPSAIGNGGGLVANYRTATEQYSDTFQLGLRMIQVASGVTVGLFVAQIFVYALGRRKNAAYFAF